MCIRPLQRSDPSQPCPKLAVPQSQSRDLLQNKLLLQQRAASKITFPKVWANTCCSHQLSGFSPTEIDPPEAVADGSVTGSRLAAVRKLAHELGIPAHQVCASGYKVYMCLTGIHRSFAHLQSGIPSMTNAGVPGCFICIAMRNQQDPRRGRKGHCFF